MKREPQLVHPRRRRRHAPVKDEPKSKKSKRSQLCDSRRCCGWSRCAIYGLVCHNQVSLRPDRAHCVERRALILTARDWIGELHRLKNLLRDCQHSRASLPMSTQMGPTSMDKSHNDFFDLEEVEVQAKRKLPKPVGVSFGESIHLPSFL